MLCLLTIKHLLIECADFNDVRHRFYQVLSLQDLFKIVQPEVILELVFLMQLRCTDFYELFECLTGLKHYQVLAVKMAPVADMA